MAVQGSRASARTVDALALAGVIHLHTDARRQTGQHTSGDPDPPIWCRRERCELAGGGSRLVGVGLGAGEAHRLPRVRGRRWRQGRRRSPTLRRPRQRDAPNGHLGQHTTHTRPSVGRPSESTARTAVDYSLGPLRPQRRRRSSAYRRPIRSGRVSSMRPSPSRLTSGRSSEVATVPPWFSCRWRHAGLCEDGARTGGGIRRRQLGRGGRALLLECGATRRCRHRRPSRQRSMRCPPRAGLQGWLRVAGRGQRGASAACRASTLASRRGGPEGRGSRRRGGG